MKQVKKILGLLVIILFFSSVYIKVDTQAAMTKGQVNTKIAFLEKQIKVLTVKLKKEKVREKKKQQKRLLYMQK